MANVVSFLIASLAIVSVASGITVDLIHRDSPNSPFSSNSNTSRIDSLYDSFRRSFQRARWITSRARGKSVPSVYAPVYANEGEYLVELSIGTPPTKFIGIVDTGSDLTWTQCKPCEECFDQDIPLFNPATSSTYDILTCDSKECGELSSDQQECSTKNTCSYQYSYGDRSYTLGDLSTDTLSVGPQASATLVKDLAFGCGHENQGTFRAPATGLFGLGQGPLSFPSQTKSNPSFGGKFAFCLIPYDGQVSKEKHSKISFGDSAVIKGDGVVSTPVAYGGDFVDTFYYLTLESVSVGHKNLPFKTRSRSRKTDVGSSANEGNIIIDSGTTLTILPEDIYDQFSKEVTGQIKGEPADDPQGVLPVCYKSGIHVPTITFHFTGADLALGAANTFIPVTEDVVCLTIVSAAGSDAIFGNLSQANFIVAHDIDGKTVSFKPTDCTTYTA